MLICVSIIKGPTVVSFDNALCEYDLNVCDHGLNASNPQTQYPGILSRARGQGTFCAIDICDDETRNRILLTTRDKGMRNFTIQSLRILLVLRYAFIVAPTHVQWVL